MKSYTKLALYSALFSALTFGCGDNNHKKKIPTNQLPVPIISLNPSSGYVPQLVNIDISNSYDPDGSISSYKLDYDSINGVNLTSPDKQGTNLQDIIQHTYTTQGTRQITLEVTDNIGATGTTTATINIGSGNPIINPISYPTSSKQTGENITYSFNPLDPNGNIIDYYFNITLTNKDGTQTTRIPTTGNLNTINRDLTDNEAGNFSVTAFAKDNDGNITTYTFPTIPVYLSEAHAQQIIKTTLESLVSNPSIKTKPLNPLTDITYDVTDDYLGTALHSDARLKYNAAIVSALDGSCSSGTELHIDFVDVANSEELQSPQVWYGIFDISNCKLANAFFYDNSFVYFEPNPTPPPLGTYKINSTDTTPRSKQQLINDITALVQSADGEWNYKPVAQTFTNLTLAPSNIYGFDFKNNNIPGAIPSSFDPDSYDPDGTIINYQVNWGDGSPIENSSNGIFSHSYDLPNNIYGLGLITTDDEGSQSNTAVIVISTTN